MLLWNFKLELVDLFDIEIDISKQILIGYTGLKMHPLKGRIVPIFGDRMVEQAIAALLASFGSERAVEVDLMVRHPAF